ncbi:MAG: hypothetical protein ABEI53_03860 [Candidatus Magasanikbacteria bacterium]
MIFYPLLFFGMLSGVVGGWKFGLLKNELDSSWHKTFDSAAVLMLIQDVLIALFYLRSLGEILVFLIIIFFCPAIGFLVYDKGYCRDFSYY